MASTIGTTVPSAIPMPSYASGMARVELVGAGIVRGGATVAHDLDLDVEPGTVLALVGPSGSGKTSVLRAIAGLDRVEPGVLPRSLLRLFRIVRHTPQQLPSLASFRLQLQRGGQLLFGFGIEFVRVAPAGQRDVLTCIRIRQVVPLLLIRFTEGRGRESNELERDHDPSA